MSVTTDATKTGLDPLTPAQIAALSGMVPSGGGLALDYGPAFPGTFPTATAGAAGVLTGYYAYFVTYITATGETDCTTATPTPVQVTSQQINLTNIPVSSDASVTGRKIYRTVDVTVSSDPTKMKQAYLVATLNDNTTTTYTDNTADATILTAAQVPAINTAAPYLYRGSAMLAGLIGNSVSLGQGALNTRTGYANTAVGVNAMQVNVSGVRNVSIGTLSLPANTTGSRNTAIGVHALNGNVAGSDQTAVGYGALFSYTDATQTNINTGVGSYALYNLASGGGNTAIGLQAGQQLTTGINNTLIGFQAGQGTAGANNAQGNSSVGYSALAKLGNGSNFNSVFGMFALSNATSGSFNTAMGYNALGASVSASSNVGIGPYAGSYETASHSIYIDNRDRTNLAGGKANALIYGVTAAAAKDQVLKLNAAVTKLVTTVSNLPSAATVGVGAEAFVTDASGPTFGATVTGGGAVAVPVYSDGTNWKVG